MDRIIKYFPELTVHQRQQFTQLASLYKDWNCRINVISRKDIDNIYVHHVLHSLAIAKVISFTKNTRILDVGTGGGFPGIPLAIFFPNCKFTLIDSIGKKITVVHEVFQSLGLTNVEALKVRAEDLNGEFDFVVTRAVAPLPTLAHWVNSLISPGGSNQLPNGILALKGGDLKEELVSFRKDFAKWEIGNFFEEDYFTGKSIIFVPRK